MNGFAAESLLKLILAQEAAPGIAFPGGEDGETFAVPEANEKSLIRDQAGRGFIEMFVGRPAQGSRGVDAGQARLQRRPDSIDRCSGGAVPDLIAYDALAQETKSNPQSHHDDEAESSELKKNVTPRDASHNHAQTTALELWPYEYRSESGNALRLAMPLRSQTSYVIR